ncbi:MAG: discoidin domain-containing protein, partial [Planctomycetota bacterium]
GAAAHYGDDYDMAWYPGTNDPFEYPALDTWQYLVYTYDGATQRVYLNGEMTNEKTVPLFVGGGIRIKVGAQANGDNSGTDRPARAMFTGAIAQVRIHDGVLTPEQIQRNAQIRIHIPGIASLPSPKDGDPDVPLRDLILSWEPGEFPGTHTVYLSEDMNAVESGTAETVLDIDVNSVAPGPLNYETTYYWRVDEVNDSPDKTVYEGSIWSFTTEPYAVLLPAQVISATASSQAEGQGPENTINESGLVDDLHSIVLTDMWVTTDGEALPAWIQYEFKKVYKLHEMLIWNYNGQSILTMFGLQDITIEYSTNGSNWTALTDVPQVVEATGMEGYAYNTTVAFDGAAAKYVKITANSNWSSGLFDQYGLSEVRFMYIPTDARYPLPEDGAADIAVDVILGWRAGRDATEHKVYISNDEQSVTDGTAPAVTVSQASYGPLSLDLASTYYWRIDEVNNSAAYPVWEGGTWSFTTDEYLVVDDFESYNDIEQGDESNPVYATWSDGGYGPTNDPTNGSTIGYLSVPSMETDIVHGGRQSVPVIYDNTAANLSEITVNPADLPIGRDWTVGSPAILTLWFYGDTDNPGTDQVYVKVNGIEKAVDVDLTAENWQEVNIDLVSFGADLQNVASLAISIQGTGSGIVLIDDIRLYSSGDAE